MAAGEAGAGPGGSWHHGTALLYHRSEPAVFRSRRSGGLLLDRAWLNRSQRAGNRGRSTASGVASTEACRRPASCLHHGAVLFNHGTTPVVGGETGPAPSALLGQRIGNRGRSIVGSVTPTETCRCPTGLSYHGSVLFNHRTAPVISG